MSALRIASLVVVSGMLLAAGPASGDLVGYFKFDSFDQTVFTDDSGQGMRGFLGQPYTDPGSVPGPSGEANDLAVSFDGEGGLVVDDSAAEVLNILDAPITLECWARSTNDPGGHIGLISYGIPGGRPNPGGYKLGLSDGNLLFTTFGVVDVWSEVAFPFDGEWHHLATVYSVDEGGVIFYLDGVEEQFVAESRPMRDPGAKELDIGTQYTAIGRFDGDIDRVRISTVALSADELDSDAASVKAVRDDTVAYFSFDEGAVPYTSEGYGEPKSTAVSLRTWVIDHPPAESAGSPDISDDSPSGEAGDTSLEFDGTQIAVVDDINGVLNFSDGDWTLEAWAKTDFNTEEIRMVIFYYGHSGHGYSLSLNLETETLQVTTLGIADMASDTAAIPDFEWNHYAVVHKAGESITYFVNGQEMDTRSYANLTIPADTTVLYIGSEPNGVLPFTGLIDRIRISNSALTADQLDSDPAPAGVLGWELH